MSGIKKAYKQVTLQQDIPMPHKVWTLFSDQCKNILIAGDQISFGEDFATLDQARYAISWIADQLGGKITWKKVD